MRAVEAALLLVFIALGLIAVTALVGSHVSVPSPSWLDPGALGQWLRATI